MQGDGFASLRELIKDLERVDLSGQPEICQATTRQAAEALRVAFTALRKIAWLPDKSKMAADTAKTAKYEAMLALKKCKAVAEDFAEKV